MFIKGTPAGPVFDSVGEPLLSGPPTDDAPDGCVAIWPIRQDGSEGRWQVSATQLRSLIESGFARLGTWKEQNTTIYYLKRGEAQKVVDGVFAVSGTRADGSVITDAGDYETTFVPTDVWRLTSHDAGNSGSRLLAKILPGRKFPFPKSLYAVEDALRFFVSDKPDAVVLDFFAGSGTTAHAVMRLNKQDGGRRQCISVTNNEVSADEQRRLQKDGLRPGDPEWEAQGICDFITKPRIEAAITGQTPEGGQVPGDYKFTDEFPIADGFEENAEFFTLTYENPIAIGHNRAFERMAPLLWLRAGATGHRIDTIPDTGWTVSENYGILWDLDQAGAFLQAVEKADDFWLAYVVTDDDRRFQSVARHLPATVEVVRLYESYLSNFQFTGVEP